MTIRDYEGAMSTLCAGCGHDSITAALIRALWELSLQPHLIAKMSGIGCSSKTPTYFASGAHGFNSVHGRMPAVATGANAANRELYYVGISGDGDSLSIGLGQMCHAIRRNLRMLYVIENNGVYGLTKGQFSATSDAGQVLKYYGKNELPAIDLALEAIVGGCTFVARSFSGDAKQVQTLLKAAISHKGTAVLDIISPCVTFNNAPESNKSYDYGKEHEIALHEIDFMPKGYVPEREEITVGDYEAGETISVTMHDGSQIRLKKLDNEHDPRNRAQAIATLEKAQLEQLFITGLIYYEEPRATLAESLYLTLTPLAHLSEDKLRPSKAALDKLMQDFM
jgi:2-oxoglutarate ferredoxin oxidoreductase subunit beta